MAITATDAAELVTTGSCAVPPVHASSVESAMHSTRGCETMRENSGPKKTAEASKSPQETDNLIEFSPKQVSSRSKCDIECPPSYRNADQSVPSKEENGRQPTDSSQEYLTNDTLLDEPIKEPGQDGVFSGKEETVQVTLRRKRKGRKGKSSTYDLMPFLSY